MLPNLPNLPNADKPWAKTVARVVVCATILGLVILAYLLKTHNSLHIPEVVGLFLLFLTIVPPNLAILYPWLLPPKHLNNNGNSTVR
ncbi:MAG: hypothetical protein ABSA39_14435 [Edaphobacter sp.]